jgi:hypothetical protein
MDLVIIGCKLSNGFNDIYTHINQKELNFAILKILEV